MTALPEPVSTGLTRLARRWQQLPLDQAVVMSGGLRAAIEEYAALVYPGVAVPRVPPAVMPDRRAHRQAHPGRGRNNLRLNLSRTQ